MEPSSTPPGQSSANRDEDHAVATRLRSRTTWWGVQLDAPDVHELATFYSRLLDWQIFGESDADAAVAPSADGGYYLGIQYESRYVRPVWPAAEGSQQMSMHLDFEVEDLDAAVAHAVSVGAVLADFQPQETVRVLLDPAGHPFCLYLDPNGAPPDPGASAPPDPSAAAA